MWYGWDVYRPKRVEHHQLPVGQSLEHINWHLANLWEGGWRVMVAVTEEEHHRIHTRMRERAKVTPHFPIIEQDSLPEL